MSHDFIFNAEERRGKRRGAQRFLRDFNGASRGFWEEYVLSENGMFWFRGGFYSCIKVGMDIRYCSLLTVPCYTPSEAEVFPVP